MQRRNQSKLIPHSSRLFFLVGPSAAGKDTLLKHLKKTHYANNQPMVAHRYITRPVRENDENHIALSEFDFQRRKQAELFLFDWESHGKNYRVNYTGSGITGSGLAFKLTYNTTDSCKM